MSGCVRPYDSPCRYGGEEFLIVLPGCDIANATLRAEEIRGAFSTMPFQIPEGVLNVTCSLGVTASSGTAGFRLLGGGTGSLTCFMSSAIADRVHPLSRSRAAPGIFRTLSAREPCPVPLRRGTTPLCKVSHHISGGR